MLGTASTLFIVALTLFCAVSVLVRFEEVRGRRVVLRDMRSSLDAMLSLAYQTWRSLWHDFSKYVVRLGWYYSVHSFLRIVLNALVSAYTFFEHLFERNRKRAKELRKEKRIRKGGAYLAKVAEHKESISMTEEQQDKLLKEKLEQDH